MRASILHLVGLVGYVNANTTAIYNVTAGTAVVQQQQPYESAPSSTVDINTDEDVVVSPPNLRPRSLATKQRVTIILN